MVDRLKELNRIETIYAAPFHSSAFPDQSGAIFLSNEIVIGGTAIGDYIRLILCDGTNEMWNERYQTPEYIFGDQPCQWLIVNQHRLPQAGEALALCDGEGRNGVFLAELGLPVTSVDLSEVGLSMAHDLAIKREVA